MLLFPHENEILTSDDGRLVLTDQRIYLNYRQWGKSYSNSIFLEDISSIETTYRSFTIFLALAFATVAYSVYVEHNEWALFSGLFLIMWVLFRTQTITITPNGGKPLSILANNIFQERVEELIYKTSLAKSLRTAEIKGSVSLITN